MLSIAIIIIIIIIQQFEDVNALQPPIFIDFRQFFSNHPLLDYPAQVRKSANLHNQDGRHRIICILNIDVNAFQSSIFIRSLQFFFLNTL